MCTAVCYKTKSFYFGRTLDNDVSYGEEVVVTPRRFPFSFRHAGQAGEHYAMIGTAFVPDGFPLYYDAVNEKGLCAAGLNFVGSAFYGKGEGDKVGLAQFEFIPYLLGSCASVREAAAALQNITVLDEPYNTGMPPAKLHWLIADRKEAVTLECTGEGMRLYENPVGVLTNEPPFPVQMFRLNDFMGLSPCEPKNTFSRKLPLRAYSRGMGALGLPGDLSSSSRFVRAAFAARNAVSGSGEAESVAQFFHILGFVSQPRGCAAAGEGYEVTIYSACCNADAGVYYYSTYEDPAVRAVDMRREDLGGKVLARYPFRRRLTVLRENSVR